MWFADSFAFLCCFTTAVLLLYTTTVFFVCRCCSLCELNRRRRVARFKRRLRLRLSVYTACVFARVFATLGGFILPSAVAVAVCAACRCCSCCRLELPLPEPLPRCRCAACRLPAAALPPLPPGAAAVACLHMRARAIPHIRKGGQGIESASAGGESPLRAILINGYSKTQTIHLPVERAGIRGQRWGEWVQKDP